jgi:energy-coupling factor transport system permease protein
MLKSLKGIMFIILFTVVMNILFSKEGEVIFSLGIISITTRGVYTSAMIAARLVLLVVGSSVLTLTTEPLKLTVGIEYILKPLKKIGVPAHEIAMMMSIALRFIPTLMDELDKIKKAQMSRGADFETGGIIKKANALVPLLVPLFVSAFKRADELAEAMDSRCYRGDVKRTRLHPLVYKKYDYVSFAVAILYLIIIVLSVILF